MATKPKPISRRDLYARCGYKPHPGQVKIHMNHDRFRTVAGGRRSGKSKGGGFELLDRAFMAYFRRARLQELGRRAEYWIIGPEYGDSEKEFRVLYDACRLLEMPFDKPGTYNNVEAGSMSISLWNGLYQVHAKSAKYPGTLVGEGLYGTVLSEAAKLKRSVMDRFVRPALADYNGWVYAGSTPEGKNWFWEWYQRGQDARFPEYWSTRIAAWSNPYVYPKGATPAGLKVIRDAINNQDAVDAALIELAGVDPEIASLMVGMSQESFNQEIAADFTEYVGRVFKEWDEDIHVKNIAPNPALPYYAAVDYGWTNPFVWLLLQVDGAGRVYVVGEYYETGKEIDQVADEILARGLCPRGTRAIYPDPASPSDSATLARRLRVPAAGGTGGPIPERIKLIRRALREQPAHLPAGDPERKPHLYVDRSCRHMISEMEAYRYPDSPASGINAPEIPLAKDNHTPEALGRFYAGYFGLSGNGSRVSQAEMG
jgi:hypothetical protein